MPLPHDPGGLSSTSSSQHITDPPPPLPINSPDETRKAVDTLNALTSSFPPYPPPSNDGYDSDNEMDFSTCDATDKVGDGSLLATANIPNKSSSSGESNLSKRKRTADQTGSDLNSVTEPVIGSKAKKSSNITSLNEALLENRYDGHCQGPFDVLVQPEANSNISLHPLTVGRILSASTKQDIIEIKKIGFSKISVQMKSRKAANDLIKNPALKAKNLIAFIPSFRTSRQGIIRNIPLEFTEEEIKKEIVCPYEVVSVRRLNRRASTLSDSGSESVSYIPSKTVCITFKGQILPKYIFFCMVRYDVTPFISKVSICSLCLRYGHTSTQCKGHPRCFHCAERSHEEGSSCPRINSPPTCANCKGPHNSKDLSCPERLIQRQIRELAATKNIPLIEARRLIRSNNSSLGTNPRFDFSNFPVLNEPYSPLSPASSPNIPTSSPTSFPFSFADTVKFPPTPSSSSSPSLPPAHPRHSSSPLLSKRPPPLIHPPTSPLRSPNTLKSPTSGNHFAFPPSSSFIAPNGRMPQVCPNGAASYSPTSSASPPLSPNSPDSNQNFQFSLSLLLKLLLNLVEKFAPFLKTFGLYDDISSLLQSALNENNSINQLYNAHAANM